MTGPTWAAVLRQTEAELHSRRAARWVVERASGWEGSELPAHLGEGAPARAVAHVEDMVARRLAGEPLQYVLGRWQFRSLELYVDRRVLIPRPETETVAGVVVSELMSRPPPLPSSNHLVVDLGTGSGAIALSVAAEVAAAQVWATDVSAAALAVARANLAGLGRAGTKVHLVEGDWWEALPDELRGTVDFVVSNPPYVADHEDLPAEVADWEPAGALRAGPTGLEALEVVVGGAPEWLRRPGALVTEVAPHQGEAALTMAKAAGFAEVEVRPDLAGRARTLVARL